jgi:hypothetical protein
MWIGLLNFKTAICVLPASSLENCTSSADMHVNLL